MRRQVRNFQIRQWVGLWVVAWVSIIGTLWYWLVEGLGFVEALYQSIITVSTVGFGEVTPLDTSGRIFTIGLILIGVSAVIYTLGAFAEAMIESSVDRFMFRRRERTLERMSNHTIICGYGRMGTAVTRLLPDAVLVGVVEIDPDRVDAALGDGLVAIQGDCTLDETLTAAGVARASRVIVCLQSDSDAISTVLSAKVLNPAVHVVTRYSEAGSGRKLRLAGADHVVSPIEMGAQRLVGDALEPSIGAFLDASLHDPSVGLSIRPIRSAAVIAAAEVKGLEHDTGVRILGRQDSGGKVVNLSGSVEPGDTLFATGSAEELSEFAARIDRLG